MAATYPADTFQEGVDLTIEASNQLAQVVRGDANTEVTVADGSTIPSIRKAQTDSMYFKEPELWVTGQTETDYLQLKKYIDPTTSKESWWFAKSAMVSNPIAMGTSPFGDDNWTLYTPEDLFISGKAEYESVYQALKGKAAEAGYNLVRGSFEEGGTLTNTNDVLWYQSNGVFYSWNGTLPKVVAAGATPATSGGFVDRSAERRKHYPDDIAEFGYVYGSGIDGSASVLAAIAKTGGARITGATTLSRFDWPSGARLTGSGKINYMRVPNTPCNLNSELPVDHSLIKAVFVHQVYDICDMLQLKTAGFNTLIHYGQFGSSGGTMQKACDAAEAVGLKLILGGSQYGETDTPSSDLDNRECVIGYYLYDEPQMNSISVEQQQSRISAFKDFTEKALVIADFGNFSIDRNTHADGYDIVFCDAYYNDNDDDSTNKHQAVIGWAELKYKCHSAKILPCVGLFSTDANGGDSVFKNKQKQISFAKKFFDMGDGGYCAFSWESHLTENTNRDVQSDSDFYALAKELNSRPEQKAYDCDVYAFSRDKMGDAMLLYNKDYSSEDVSPFQTIDVGSFVNERSTSFKRGGIAAKNAGGVLATNLKNHGYIAVNLFFYNGADSGNVYAAITTCVDDFYTNIDQLSETLKSATRWRSGVETTPGLGVGLRITPSLSYQHRWKFLSGMIVDCAWSGSTF